MWGAPAHLVCELVERQPAPQLKLLGREGRDPLRHQQALVCSEALQHRLGKRQVGLAAARRPVQDALRTGSGRRQTSRLEQRRSAAHSSGGSQRGAGKAMHGWQTEMSARPRRQFCCWRRIFSAMAAAEVGVVMAASFSTMLIGARLSSSLGPEARKVISYLYANLVFPAMVFRGVAAIDLSGVDSQLMLTILLSKLAVATACLLVGLVALGSRGLPHAAAYAMAASHSFDVTMGVPMAKVAPLAPPTLPPVVRLGARSQPMPSHPAAIRPV
jgi:hypothetical protein